MLAGKNQPPQEKGPPARLRRVKSIGGSSWVTSVTRGEAANWFLATGRPWPQFPLGLRLAVHALPAHGPATAQPAWMGTKGSLP